MLNPVVLLPLPVALAILGLLAAAALWCVDTWPAAKPPAHRPRHRMTPAIAADPNRRDWAALAAERLNSSHPRVLPDLVDFDPLDHRVPLTEVERRMSCHPVVVVPGVDRRQPLMEFEQYVGESDTRELVAVQ